GASYDWLLGRSNRISLVGTFTSNAFSRDQLGGALEFALGENFSLRAGYKMEFEAPQGSAQASLDNGLSGGLTFSIPMRKGSDSRFSIDYGYRYTEIFNGIHNIGLRIDL
ncbi:MAG: DUF3308 domain-containing protein, partial [Saprospiraceae bacterium]|nr:DUF3308 domain-containing protein [Saprospiraceae bacterium]